MSISLLEAGLAEEASVADADPLLASFWATVFSRDAVLLAEMVTEARLDIGEWRRQKALSPRSRLEAAFQLLYLNRTSFSGSLKSNAGPMGGMMGSNPALFASRFNRAALARRIMVLSDLAERVRRVRCADWRETVGLAERICPRPFVYLDPPYYAKSGRLYP